jgi:hypothetical protein
MPDAFSKRSCAVVTMLDGVGEVPVPDLLPALDTRGTFSDILVAVGASVLNERVSVVARQGGGIGARHAGKGNWRCGVGAGG